MFQQLNDLGQNTNFGARRSLPEFRQSLATAATFDGLPEQVGRYDLLRTVKDVAPHLGITPGLLQFLEYLIQHTMDQDWEEGGRPIVYKSVTRIARDFGISERQVRNRERQLFCHGLLTWKDSGNHRRCGQRGERGELLWAYGVDLRPLAQRCDELRYLADEIRAEEELWNHLRRRISAKRRQARAFFAEAYEHPYVVLTQLETLTAESETLSTPVEASTPLSTLEHLDIALAEHLETLRDLLSEADRFSESESLESASFSGDISGKPETDFRHKHITTTLKLAKASTSSRVQSPTPISPPHKSPKPAPTPNPCNAFQRKAERAVKPNQALMRSSAELVSLEGGANRDRSANPRQPNFTTGIEHITLHQITLILSERFRDFLPGSIRSVTWTEIVEAAYAVSSTLGINQSAWADACGVMGRNAAAISVVLIDRGVDRLEDPIRSPGGYLRRMTDRARRGELHLHRSIFGLLSQDGIDE